MEQQPTERPAPTLTDLYPHFDGAQLEQAEDLFERYVALTLRLYARIRDDPVAWDRFRSLTIRDPNHTIEMTRPPSPS